ncbi:MAG: response regulator [Puniceicoccaceae bacterium]
MNGKTGRILVVDDEPLMRDTLELGLGGTFEVSKVASGGEALALARETSFPVVVLDLRMEGMDGIETLKELRKVDPNQKVILLTAHQSVETAIDAVNLGAFNYLTKPCDLGYLRKLVQSGFRLYEEEKTRKEELRKHLLEAHDELLSVLCHEFNTPLNALIGFAGFLSEESAAPEHREMARYIEKSGKRLHEVFVEIMDYINSRERPSVERRDVFSIRALEEWMTGREFPCRAHLIFSGAEDTASARFYGPFQSLKIIFSKIARAGRGDDRDMSIIAWLRRTDSDRRMHFQIQDSGLRDLLEFAGSPEALFSPYATASLSLTGESRGLGLHLATCRNIAESAGISLRCERTPLGDVGIRLEVPVTPLPDDSPPDGPDRADPPGV